MSGGDESRTDGGVTDDRREGDGQRSSAADLDLELPEDSVFTYEEYLEMYRVATSEPAFSILRHLQTAGRLSTSELSERVDREANNLHYHLRRLGEHALIVNRRDPTTGTETPYSYYELTDHGRVVLSEGPVDGIETLAAAEAEFSEQYSG